ncbi:Protein of unknown function, partial [Gryllus bimaculatus]
MLSALLTDLCSDFVPLRSGDVAQNEMMERIVFLWYKTELRHRSAEFLPHDTTAVRSSGAEQQRPPPRSRLRFSRRSARRLTPPPLPPPSPSPPSPLPSSSKPLPLFLSGPPSPSPPSASPSQPHSQAQ